MLHLSFSYKTLLRIAGLLLLAYGLYWVARALLVQVDVSGDLQYSGLLLFWNPGEIISYIFCGLPLLGSQEVLGSFVNFVPGPVLYVGLGLFLLALSTRRPHLSYWGLQVVFWLGSMSCWAGLALTFNPHGMDVPASFTPFLWMTLFGSLLLLSVYRPLLGLLRRLSMALAVKQPQQQQGQPEILTTVSTQKVQTRE